VKAASRNPRECLFRATFEAEFFFSHKVKIEDYPTLHAMKLTPAVCEVSKPAWMWELGRCSSVIWYGAFVEILSTIG